MELETKDTVAQAADKTVRACAERGSAATEKGKRTKETRNRTLSTTHKEHLLIKVNLMTTDSIIWVGDKSVHYLMLKDF